MCLTIFLLKFPFCFPIVTSVLFFSLSGTVMISVQSPSMLNNFRTVGPNFQWLLGWCLVTIGWVVPVPIFYQVGLGLHTVLFPGVLLLCGHWFMSYHFGKHLTRQTKSLSCFLILGFDSFFENRQILHKIDPLKSNSKNFL